MLNELIGFSGKMTSGKTTQANILVEKYGFVRIAIGDEIKKVSNLVIENRDLLKTHFETLDISKKILREFEDLYTKVKYKDFKQVGGIYEKNEGYRYLTQQTGDILRTEYGSDIWTKYYLQRVNKLRSEGKKVVCNDVRMASEYDLLRNEGFNIIRLEVEQEEQIKRVKNLYKSFSLDALKHKTETELDDHEFELVVDTTYEPIGKSFTVIEEFLLGR